MMYSMTGFGTAECQFNGTKVSVELRSLNSRGMDLSVKLPSSLRDWELELRKIVTDKLQRGKVSAFIKLEGSNNDSTLNINKTAFRNMTKEIADLADETGLDKNDLLGIVIRLPEIWDTEIAEVEPGNWEEALPALEKAIENINAFRREEGRKLEVDLLSQCEFIEEKLTELSSFEDTRVNNVKEKLYKRLEELDNADGVDHNRLEQELLYYLEKMDISEEKVRLSSHCKYFRETADQDEMSKGKKLSFISQEMGREINTIGSKANHLEIQRVVVEMKDALEKIKEQVQNVV